MAKARRTRLLVVDDDADIRDALVELLRLQGYSSLEAANGQQAWDLVQQGGLGGMLLDLMMPVLDGWSLMEKLRAQQPVLPVIALSASNRPPPEGVLAYFRKPVDLEVLVSTLHQHFE